MPKRATRDTILQVAQRLFTTKGFANASISEICATADVSPPTVYHHFGSKDGLFQEVVEQTLDLDEFVQLLTHQVDMGDGWRDKLRAYVRTYLTHFPIDMLNPGLHLQDSTQLNGTSLRRLQAGVTDIHHLTRAILREGAASSELRDLDVDHAASCLMGAVDSFVRAKVYLGADYEPDQLTESIVDLFCHGLAAEREAAQDAAGA